MSRRRPEEKIAEFERERRNMSAVTRKESAYVVRRATTAFAHVAARPPPPL